MTKIKDVRTSTKYHKYQFNPDNVCLEYEGFGQAEIERWCRCIECFETFDNGVYRG